MSNTIQPIAAGRPPLPRPRDDAPPRSPTINIYAPTRIIYDTAPAPAKIAPALISLEDMTVLLNSWRDLRHLPGDIPYRDDSAEDAPAYYSDVIELLPLEASKPAGGGVDRRA